MKYPHQVLYGGKLYKAGEEVPEPEMEQELPFVPSEEEPVKEEKKVPKKRATKKQ